MPDPLRESGSREAQPGAGSRSAIGNNGHSAGNIARRVWTRSIRDRVLTVAATVLAFSVGFAAWRFYSEWRLGRIELTNGGDPLVAQVLPEQGDDPIGEPFDLVTRTTLALPAGDYRLRVHGVGRLGRTFRFAVNQGETQTHAVSLDEGRLLGGEPIPQFGGQPKLEPEPRPFARVTAVVELVPGKCDVAEWNGKAMIRRDGLTGKPVWDSSQSTEHLEPKRDPTTWLRVVTDHWTPRLVEPAVDLDGDSTGDLVWMVQNVPAFLAMSGKDGSMLWNYTAALDGPGGPQPEGPLLPGPNRPAARYGSVVGMPATADVDQDGTPDLIATMTFLEMPAEIKRRIALRAAGQGRANQNERALVRRIIQAISGRTGRLLWSYAVDPTFATYSHPSWGWPATLALARPHKMVSYLNGSRLIALEPATGKLQTGSIDVGFVPVRPVQFADLTGDGQPEILALGAAQAANPQTLAAIELGTGRALWVEPVRASYEAPFDQTTPPDWPLVVDLDGDGRSEVVVPDSGPMANADGYQGIRALDGRSGQTRWVRPMCPRTKGADGLYQVARAPDLDHDGVSDLVTTSIFLGRYPISSHVGGPRSRSGSMSTLFRERMAVHSGGGMWILRRTRPRSSGRCTGGVAAPMVGRSWRSLSAGSIPSSAWRPRRKEGLSSTWRPRRVAKCPRPSDCTGPAQPTWTAMACPISGVKPTMSCGRSAARRLKLARLGLVCRRP